MRQPACILRLSFGVALFHCVVGSAQEPSDPKALMRTASKINNLVAPDAKPWHIKASFQLFDEQGAVSDEGNYEEFWSSPTKFKRILTGKTFLLTNYGSAKGILRGESKGETPDFAFDTHRDFVNPLPAAEMIDHSSYSSKPVKSGDLQLTCLTLASLFGPTHCMDNSEALVRISAYPAESIQVLRNRMLHFEDRIIPGDLKFVRNGKTVFTAHIDTVEALNSADETLFTAPPDAIPETRNRHITISAGVAQAFAEPHGAPVYPAEARNAGVSGTVVLGAMISKDGTIKNLQVVDGPPMLREAALKAVHTWHYRPYLLNGEPVEVETTINVVFSLGPPSR